MTQTLPTGNFRFLTEDEITHIQDNIQNVPDDNLIGYILNHAR